MILENSNEVCTRCGCEKVLQNLQHTRRHGYLCLCGNSEWEERKKPAREVLPCGHDMGIVYGENSWTCAICGASVKPPMWHKATPQQVQQVANHLGRVVRVELAAARAIVEEVAAMGDNFDFEGIESLIIQANEFLEKYPRIKDGDA